MRIAVFGATGIVGRAIMQEALASMSLDLMLMMC